MSSISHLSYIIVSILSSDYQNLTDVNVTFLQTRICEYKLAPVYGIRFRGYFLCKIHVHTEEISCVSNVMKGFVEEKY